MIPAVSIIIVAGTGRPFLSAALQSLIAQDMQEWEAVVVECCHGADADSVRAQIDAVPDERVRAVQYDKDDSVGQGCGGRWVGVRGASPPPWPAPYVSRKWNFGIERACGSLVGFLDDDDMKSAGWLSDMAAPLLADPSLAATLCGVAGIDSSGAKTGGGCGVSLERDVLLRGNWVTTGQLLVRRQVIDALGGFDESLGVSEDYDLALRLSDYPWLVVESVTSLKRDCGEQVSQRPGIRFYTQDAVTRIAEKLQRTGEILPWYECLYESSKEPA